MHNRFSTVIAKVFWVRPIEQIYIHVNRNGWRLPLTKTSRVGPELHLTTQNIIKYLRPKNCKRRSEGNHNNSDRSQTTLLTETAFILLIAHSNISTIHTNLCTI